VEICQRHPLDSAMAPEGLDQSDAAVDGEDPPSTKVPFVPSGDEANTVAGVEEPFMLGNCLEALHLVSP
jgi:hypothetical protein